MSKNRISCWVCGSENFSLLKKSDVTDTLNSNNFAITNFDYGKTGELQKCQSCGFIQCVDLDEVVKFYENLEDHEYENTRKERKLQEDRLIRFLSKFKSAGKLLDIGAGSGIMVESALEKGFLAEGLEPSKWLQGQAAKLDLPVHQGVFPHPKTPGPYDIISFVDVIEHVTEPGILLTDIHKALHDEGIFALVTPDVNSMAARFFGFKWWHYRFAHIGYFNKKNLRLLLERSGFTVIKITRPAWYFSLRYLTIRFLSFLPSFLRFTPPKFFDRITIPVNLRDSLLVVCKKDASHA